MNHRNHYHHTKRNLIFSNKLQKLSQLSEKIATKEND